MTANADLSLDSFLNSILSASEHRQYQLLAALLLIGAVWAVRKYSPKIHGKTGEFLNSDLGGVVLSLSLSAIGAVAAALETGKKLSLDLAVSALANAAVASGLFVMGKKAMPSNKADDAAPAADKPADPPASPPAAALLPILFLVSLTFVSSCAAMKQIGINLANCAVGQVPSIVAALLPDVEAVLKSESADWQASLQKLGQEHGLDALTCALKAIAGPLAAKKMSLDVIGQRKLERANVYMARLGI